MVIRLATAHPNVAIGRLSASAYTAPPPVHGLVNTTVANRVADLAGCQIIVGTSAKWATVRDHTFGWAILDESYQMRSDMLLQIVERFDRDLFVGDPGQLDPFTNWTRSPSWEPNGGSDCHTTRHRTASP